jgi:small subunit ribosomal protein S9
MLLFLEPKFKIKEAFILKTTGRRKSAIAQVVLKPGSGQFMVNNKPVESYLSGNPSLLVTVQAPLTVLELKNNYDVFVNVQGGGVTAQAESIRLGLARALSGLDLNNRPVLKLQGFLTRDSREKERRKYGLKKARKAPQFSKR